MTTDPYDKWGDYELDIWERTDSVDADFDLFEDFCREGDESLGRDDRAEESGIGTDIPEYLDWGYMLLGGGSPEDEARDAEIEALGEPGTGRTWGM